MPKEFEEMRSKIAANLKGKKNPRTNKPYTSSEIYAIAVAQWKKSHGGKAPDNKEIEFKLCSIGKFEMKEEDEKYISCGYIATTHPDRAENPEMGWDGDILPEEMIDKIVDTINNAQSTGVPEARYASYRHDWLRQKDPTLPPAGIAQKAEKVSLGDGHSAVYVETEHLKTHPNYEGLKYDVEKGVIPGYSIEYTVNDYDIVDIDGKSFRVLKDIDFSGYGFANARLQANTQAYIISKGYKEIKEIINIKQNNIKGDESMKEAKEEEEKKDVPEEPKEEQKQEKDESPKEEPKPEEKAAEPEGEAKEYSVSKEEYDRLQKFKSMEAKEKYNKEIKEAVQKELKEMKILNAPMINKDGKTEFKELENYKRTTLVEYKEIDDNFKHPMQDGQFALGAHTQKAQRLKSNIAKQYKEASEMGNKLSEAGIPIISNWMNMSQSGDVIAAAKERMNFFDVGGDVIAGNPEATVPFAGTRIETKESYFDKFEMKASALGAFNTSNTNVNKADASWSYGSYYQSPVELNDIYGPALVNQLNDQTTVWGKLRKENWSGRSQIQFRARTARNAKVEGTSEGTAFSLSTFSGYVGKDKFQQPFAYYYAFVAVTGQMIQFAQAPGGMGDVWGTELQWSGVDLVKALNQEILGTGDGTSETDPLGFEGLILGTTGSLYGKNIATYTTLRSHKENMSSARITIDQMRKMVEKVKGGDSTIPNSNARETDLVFFCHPTQERIIKSQLQDMQRTIPTSARVGYEGTVEVDGIPVFADVDINTDDLFLIDTAHTKLAINLGPVIEYQPIAFDGKAATIKIYFNLYSDAPSNNYWAHTLATS
ncbi:MAG: hypothetical protein ACTSX6_04770 [Candidatus Heimdallarchaeaceae archaeon]